MERRASWLQGKKTDSELVTCYRCFIRATLSEIHSPVPGFNPTVHNLVTKVFDVMKAIQPFWRANFVITPLEGVCPFEEEILHSETSSPGVKERRREVIDTYHVPVADNLPNRADNLLCSWQLATCNLQLDLATCWQGRRNMEFAICQLEP